MSYSKTVEFFDRLKNSSKCVVIYGAGLEGRLLAEVASHFRCPISYIADQNTLLHGLFIGCAEIVSKHRALSIADTILISTKSKAFEDEIISEINEYYLGDVQPKVLRREEIPFSSEDLLEVLVNKPVCTKPLVGKPLYGHSESDVGSGRDNNREKHFSEACLARQSIASERENLVSLGRDKWCGKKLLFILPVGGIGGGMKVVLNEAQQMMKMGVDVTVYNVMSKKTGFSKFWPPEIPVVYGEDLASFIDIAHGFDAVCSTWYTTVKHSAALKEKLRIAYYVQDFEPNFFQYGTAAYDEALESYTFIKEAVLITKTKWNYNMVRNMTGAECAVIGPSVDIDLFKPGNRSVKSDKIAISAMIRPGTERRSPQLTLDILMHLADKHGDRIEIIVFGSDPSLSYNSNYFWRQVPKISKIRNLGILNNENVAALLSSVDIFADFSDFQAMGLTAMEAMACGCATIVPENGGCIDYAKSGRNALVINTRSKRACIDAICHLIDNRDTRESISINATKDVCEFYPEKAAYNFLNALFPEEAGKQHRILGSG